MVCKKAVLRAVLGALVVGAVVWVILNKTSVVNGSSYECKNYAACLSACEYTGDENCPETCEGKCGVKRGKC
jgi:hypothetical protein